MSRQKQGMRLPYALQKELGLEGDQKSRGKRNGLLNEREVRRAEKQRRKVRGGAGGRQDLEKPRPTNRSKTVHVDEPENEGDQHSPQTVPQQTTQPARTGRPLPKSILKNPRPQPARQSSPLPSLSPSASDASSISSRSSSPGLVIDASSRAFRDQQAEEDAEITALEKRLGMKKGKTPRLFQEDGFGDLLDGLDEEVEGKKRKREDREWIERKRRKAAAVEHGRIKEDLSTGEDEEDGPGDEMEGAMSPDPDSESSKDVEETDEFGEFQSDAGPESPSDRNVRVRENPYVAPVPASASTAKYITPSLRKAQTSEGQNHDKLRRQIQGHLNKLSEANLTSILQEVERIYQSNPRQDVTSVLIDLLLSLFCNRSSLQNTFVILHAAFITGVYKVIGTDFGAEVLLKLVDRFAEYHTSGSDGKESLNLLSLLSNLFTFNLVSSTIIYDHIRLLFFSLTESNTELLLRLIRDCGPQLRADNPTALKSIVSQTHSTAKSLETSGQQTSVRTKFMIETIMDLKNNKMRDSTATSSLTKEHITRMRKVLGSLNSRSLRATEPLRISLADLQNSDKKGKWWLVGASWKGNDPNAMYDEGQEQTVNTLLTNEVAAPTPKDFGLTTPLQHLIFTAISTSQSYIDAHVRLTKLRLKRSQEPQIARVLLRLCGSEKVYNPFYAHVAKRLCSIEGGKRMKKTVDFALWGFFRRLGERADDEEGEDEAVEQEVEVEEINNIAHLYASLVYWGMVSLSVLRVLDLAYLKENAQLFVEMMLVRVLLLCQGEGEVERVFERANEAKQVAPRLKLFLREHVKGSDLVSGREDREALKRGHKAARRVLERISMDR